MQLFRLHQTLQEIVEKAESNDRVGIKQDCFLFGVGGHKPYRWRFRNGVELGVVIERFLTQQRQV